MRLLILLLALRSTMAYAQGPMAQRLSFDLIGVDEGLPHATVSCFLDDGRGRLWIGMAEGLVVFDGSDFENVDLADGGGPLSVRGLAMDREGIVWVAAEQGPVRLDPVTRNARLLPFPDSLKSGVAIMRFNAVAPAGDGKVLFASHFGTTLYDTTAHVFTSLNSATGDPLKTYWRELRADTERDGIWLSTREQGLVFYDCRKRKLFEPAGDASISPLIGRYVQGQCPDGSGGFWCVDRKDGTLYHWDGRSKQMSSWLHLPDNPDVPTADITYLARDSRGFIWGSGRGRFGGFRFNPVDRSVVRFTWDDASIGALPYGTFNALHEGAGNCIWLANNMGIAIHDPASPQVTPYQYSVGNTRPGMGGISALAFMGDSLLWCGLGNDGLARIDLRTGELRRVVQTNGASMPYVNAMLCRGDRVLVCSWNGQFSVNARDLSVSALRLRDAAGNELNQQGGDWLAADPDGSLWMAQLQTIVRFDPLTGAAIVHLPDSFANGALRPDNRYCGAATSDGRFWLGGNLNGLACFLPQTGLWEDMSADVIEDRLKLGGIKAMVAVGDTVLWLASNGVGLIKYDIRTKEYTHYDQRHGFAELRLESVGLDARGRIWTHSWERVFCFDPVRKLAIAIDPRGTASGRVPKWSVALSHSGRVAMNAGLEIAVFDASTVGGDHMPPAPAITQVLVDGLSMAADAEGLITLRHDHTQIELRFGALLPPGSIMAYAMRSPGEAWSEFKQGRVSLRGLRPGEHRFEFRMMSKEGAWGPVTALELLIRPPWWQTLGARIAFGLLLAAAIVVLFRLRLNWIRRRERKEEAIDRTVNELKLRALRAQMNPHFVFNCMNSIDKYILMNEPEKASHYLNRFAKLVRLILNQSDRVSVALDKEVELLRYYLELESLRFEVPFTFEVNADPLLLREEPELPAMLVQPYVENAIWHGLQHKRGQGRIKVEFRKLGESLVVTVEDDGVGRAEAGRIKAQRSTVHSSKAMQVNADRMRLMDELKQGGTNVVIDDLADRDGAPLGTRVTITMPLEALHEDAWMDDKD